MARVEFNQKKSCNQSQKLKVYFLIIIGKMIVPWSRLFARYHLRLPCGLRHPRRLRLPRCLRLPRLPLKGIDGNLMKAKILVPNRTNMTFSQHIFLAQLSLKRLIPIGVERFFRLRSKVHCLCLSSTARCRFIGLLSITSLLCLQKCII